MDSSINRNKTYLALRLSEFTHIRDHQAQDCDNASFSQAVQPLLPEQNDLDNPNWVEVEDAVLAELG